MLTDCIYQGANICPPGPITASATFNIPPGYTGNINASANVASINLSFAVGGYGALPPVATTPLEFSVAQFSFVDGKIVNWLIEVWWYVPAINKPVVFMANPAAFFNTTAGSTLANDLAVVCLPADCTHSNFIGSGDAYNLSPGTWTVP